MREITGYHATVESLVVEVERIMRHADLKPSSAELAFVFDPNDERAYLRLDDGSPAIWILRFEDRVMSYATIHRRIAGDTPDVAGVYVEVHNAPDFVALVRTARAREMN